MTSDRIKEIQEQTAYPESISVQQALLQVWNECKQEQLRIADVRLSSLADKWRDRKFEYDDTANGSNIWQHEVRFKAKAQATRDCWKELNEILKDEA